LQITVTRTGGSPAIPDPNPGREPSFIKRKRKTRGEREGERGDRGREEATIEHALDSILIAPRSSPFSAAGFRRERER
jgi:hypothetical protein